MLLGLSNSTRLTKLTLGLSQDMATQRKGTNYAAALASCTGLQQLAVLH